MKALSNGSEVGRSMTSEMKPRCVFCHDFFHFTYYKRVHLFPPLQKTSPEIMLEHLYSYTEDANSPILAFLLGCFSS